MNVIIKHKHLTADFQLNPRDLAGYLIPCSLFSPTVCWSASALFFSPNLKYKIAKLNFSDVLFSSNYVWPPPFQQCGKYLSLSLNGQQWEIFTWAMQLRGLIQHAGFHPLVRVQNILSMRLYNFTNISKAPNHWNKTNWPRVTDFSLPREAYRSELKGHPLPFNQI